MPIIEGYTEVAGCEEGFLSGLTSEQKEQLITVISRISEKSFRRGFQHGALHGNKAPINPYDLRFKYSNDDSPFTNRCQAGDGMTAIHRLKVETNLDLIGLEIEGSGWEDLKKFEPIFS